MWIAERDLSDYRDKLFSKMRDLIEANGWERSLKLQAYWIGDTSKLPDDDNIYRVNVDNVTGYVKVTCIGLEKVDATLEGNYDGVHQLPDWMQEKLTLLSMLSHEPPTEPVDGIGRRITADTYWVFC